MKKLIAVLCASTFLIPFAASAQTATANTDLQTQAQALLAQVAQLQAQLATQGGGAATTGTGAGAASGSAACPNIGRILKKGSTGPDVTRLQQFLAGDSSIYPEGNISGYYGALTEAAVKRWQTKYNVVSSGSAATTGFGMVGPRTAAAIALLCSNGGAVISPVGGYIQVSPISGNAPLTVNVVANVNTTNSCQGAIYTLNWGDNTNPIQIPVSANNCTQIAQTYQHVYTYGGTYQVMLSSGAHQTSASVAVYGNAAPATTNPNTPNTPASGESFNANPSSGAVPLTVTFTGTVTGADLGWCSTGCSDILSFGDGSQSAVALPMLQSGSQTYSVSHTYTTAGSYTATLYQGQASAGRPTVGTATIAAGGSANTTANTFNAPAITPLVGGNPRAVSIVFDYSLTTCNYAVTWGDGNTDSSPGGCTGTGTASKTVTHTYGNTGTYSISLRRDNQTNTAGISIAN